MKNEAVFINGKRKYIFCGDEQGLKLLSNVLEKGKEEGLTYDRYLLSDFKMTLLEDFLKSQKMGTFVYLAIPFLVLQQFRKALEDIGYLEEDVQYIGYGERKIPVFCCRCHEINMSNQEQNRLLCDRCSLELEVSDHYSAMHNAFLGYVAKL
ncbi:dimethylamine monooxygenase subunit DmmA family protein [Fictibacillus phosphorivorans]|uniref:dimethylamine monooxygenase subunit DmmA family protein n=1 Tax=Fictibacillus phosphorivorans TaxID=1221500 RepID=UPI003CF6DB90